MKRLFIIALSCFLVFTSFSSVFAEGDNSTDTGVEVNQGGEEQAVKKITILHTNDTHARINEGKYDGMGLAKLSTLVKQHEADNANVLLLDAGDTFHGTTFATLEQGKSIAEVFNAVGYDGMAAGNHDFNYGYERLLELKEMVTFPVLSANVIVEETGELLLPPYMIQEVDGVKLGIFGLSTPETHFKTHPKNVEGLEFTDPVQAAQEMVAELQSQEVDVIIALTHLGTDASSTDTSIKVAEGAPGIDLIVDGHSHTEDNIGESGTLIVSSGEYTKNLGVVELTFDENNELVSKEGSLITKEDATEVEPDAEVQAVIDVITASQETILAEVVGSTSVVLDGEREQVRAGETNLGNLITDAMLNETGADVALTNGGGIRASIDVGEITKGEVITVLPFGNYIVTKEVSGAVIKAALENGIDSYPDAKGAFPHVAGIDYTIDASKPAGERAVSIQINGEPIDLEKTYVLATNDFLAAGGDEYTMFADIAIKNEYPALDEVLIQYIQEKGTVSPVVENRITAINEETETEEVTEPTTGIYIVVPGDYLSKIAVKYNTTWQELQKLNQLDNPNLIFPDQEIIVPAE
ncbi:5'-nucleotidase C-terminal domain-containing protein [Chengkuizengella marina]|uniref:LysM peptidoglycan-binding domain-containing protein n=1 Tax=Chengkuizengella marina TaxID=2507566 RepID=A0A6N9Q541_9BACL|nr:5'-nucleotidase C-terminal domain-containing protein [Chengkuizengella marina]NBI29937.1 LysM peptidoglycan-binding domain-containing protein [Chengkuizengella marina]